jgi:uncharacterized glyoxalase superfamily protein PhnB
MHLIPMLPVRHLARSIAFYCDQLGFEIENRRDDWGWAMLRFGDCQLMLDQSINAHPDTPRDNVLYFYPEDVTAYHAQLRERGLEIPDLSTTFYGLTEFRLTDPDGNQLWIGQQTK